MGVRKSSRLLSKHSKKKTGGDTIPKVVEISDDFVDSEHSRPQLSSFVAFPGINPLT